LRRAKEVTRQKREADQHQAMQRCANSDDSPSVAARQSDSK